MFPQAHTAVSRGRHASSAPEGPEDGGRVPRTRAPRAAGILRLVRDFLLLEDDYEVGWEAEYAKEDQAPDLRRGRNMAGEERAQGVRCPRAALPSRRRRIRRSGQVPRRAQVCVCPLAPSRPRVNGRTPDEHVSGERG